MLGNFLKKIAGKDCLTVTEYFFNFISGGEQNCGIKVLSYDLRGDVQKEEDLDKVNNDFIFFALYGCNMVVWLGQIFDSLSSMGNNESLLKKLTSIINILFNPKKKYDLSDALSLFSQDIKTTVIEGHATVQFKINKISKWQMVLVMNVPIGKEVECEMYLFVILFDFFCKKYANAYNLITYGCLSVIEEKKKVNPLEAKLAQVVAYEVNEKIGQTLLEKIGDKN